MNTVKLMVVNAAHERDRHVIGCVFDAVEVKYSKGDLHVIQGGYLNGFIVNPLDTDEDLTIRVGDEPEHALFHLRKVSKASQRKFGTFAVVGDWALSDSSCESFMREPFSRIAELEKQVAFLTGELQAAIATIEKVREIMRTEPGYDIEDNAGLPERSEFDGQG